MAARRVLVTGGAGFIGRHLVAALLARGDAVTVLDNLHRGHREAVDERATFIEADIRDVAALDRALPGHELVYHLAAQSNVMGALQDGEYSFTTNVVGTFNVLRAAANAGAARLVFASSREVYGEPATLPVAEDAPLLARNPYGASKVAGEAYCRAWPGAARLACQVLRFANVYGPGDSGRVIPLWLARAAAGEDLDLYGGRQVLDFVWVETAVQALLAASHRPPTEPINVGSGTGTPLRTLASAILQSVGSRSQLVARPGRDVEVSRFVADVTRMRTLLGVEPPREPLFALASMAESARAAAA